MSVTTERDMSSEREILWEEDVSKWVLLSQGAEGVGFVLSAKRYKTSFSFSFLNKWKEDKCH